MGSENNVDPYLGMPIPIPGVTSSGFWEAYIVQALNKLSSHDHTTGKGAGLSQSSFTVTSNFDMKSFGIISSTFVGFSNPAALTVVPPSGSLYFVNGEFYIKDGSGNVIQLTSGGSINTSLLGGFTGDYASANAFVSYSATTERYEFYTGVNSPSQDKMATIVAGAVTIRSTTAAKNVYGLTLQTSGNISSNFGWTLPDAQGTNTNNILNLSSTGTITYLDRDTFVQTSGTQTVGGQKTFSLLPISSDTNGPTSSNLIQRSYIDSLTINGTAFGSNTSITINPPNVPSSNADGEWVISKSGTNYTWVLNSGGSFPEAPVDGDMYVRKDAAWEVLTVDVEEAPIDGKQYVRQDGDWEEISVTGGLTPLIASGTLAVNTIYSVDATGDFTFVVPTGVTNGDSIKIKRNGFGGANVFTGAFRNSETALILTDWNYSLGLTWSATRSIWIYE
jgi:hypothetical protein